MKPKYWEYYIARKDNLMTPTELNAFGISCWELVSVVSTAFAYHYHFKRRA